MAEGTEPSFGRLVFGKALSDTGQFLKYTRRDLIIGCVTMVLGILLAYLVVGKTDTMKEIVFFTAFTLAPAGAVMFAIFIWHLWLAPSALAYEAARSAVARATAVPNETWTTSLIDWAIWRQRDRYNLVELSSILAKEDPNGISSSNASAFLDLLKENTMSHKLTVIKDSEAGPYQTADTWPTYFSVPKNAALKWAADKEFDLSHIA